jgi:hypothetical protein
MRRDGRPDAEIAIARRNRHTDRMMRPTIIGAIVRGVTDDFKAALELTRRSGP